MQKLILVQQVQVPPLRRRIKRKRINRKSNRKYNKSRSKILQMTIQITMTKTKMRVPMLSHRTSKMVKVKTGRSTVCSSHRNSLIDYSLDMRPASQFFRHLAIQLAIPRLTRQLEWLTQKLKPLMIFLSHF